MKNNFKLSVLMTTMVVGLTTFSATVNSEPLGPRLNTISSSSKYLEDTDDKRLSPKMIQDILATNDGEAKLRDQYGIQMDWIDVSTNGLSDEGKKHILLKQGDPHGPSLFKSETFLTPGEKKQLQQQIERVERGEEPEPAPEPSAEPEAEDEAVTAELPPPPTEKQNQPAPNNGVSAEAGGTQSGTPANPAGGTPEHSPTSPTTGPTTPAPVEDPSRDASITSDSTPKEGSGIEGDGPVREEAVTVPERDAGADRQDENGVGGKVGAEHQDEEHAPSGEEVHSADGDSSPERVETPKEDVESPSSPKNLEQQGDQSKSKENSPGKEQAEPEHKIPEHKTPEENAEAREPKSSSTESPADSSVVTPAEPNTKPKDSEVDDSPTKPKETDKISAKPTVTPPTAPSVAPQVTLHSSEELAQANSAVQGSLVQAPVALVGNMHTVAGAFFEVAGGNFSSGVSLFADASTPNTGVVTDSSGKDYLGNATSRNELESGFKVYFDYGYRNNTLKTDVAHSKVKQHNFAVGLYTQDQGINYGFAVVQSTGSTLSTPVIPFRTKLTSTTGSNNVTGTGSDIATGTNTNTATNAITNNAVITASSSSSSASTTLTSRTKLNSTGVMGSVGLASANDYLNLGGYVLFSKAKNYRSSVGFEDQRSTVSSTQIGLDLTYGYRVYKDNKSSIVLTAGVTDVYYSQGAFTEIATSKSAKPQSLSFQSLSKNHLFLHLGAQGTYLTRVDNLLFKTDAGIRLEQALTNNRYDFKLQDGTMIKGVAGDTFTAKLVLGETIYVDNFSLRLGVELATGNKTNARVDKLTATFTYKF